MSPDLWREGVAEWLCSWLPSAHGRTFPLCLPCLAGLLMVAEILNVKHGGFLRRKVLRKCGYYCCWLDDYHVHTLDSFFYN